MLKRINYPLACLLVFTARLIYTGAGVGDSIALGALCGLYAYGQLLNSKKDALVAQEIKELALVQRDITQLKSAIDSMKVARTYGAR